MGCICTFLRAFTSNHWMNWTPRKFFQKGSDASGPVSPEGAEKRSSSTAVEERVSSDLELSSDQPRRPRSECSNTLLRRFPSEDLCRSRSSSFSNGSRTVDTSPQKFPTFVHKSPQIRHQRSLNAQNSPSRTLRSLTGVKHVTFDIPSTIAKD
ncbi:hypothetical protein HDE_09304 [Halotydeus destructor]|nr:hypothetical protein HDE_09304 [Halotydeus destructor]